MTWGEASLIGLMLSGMDRKTAERVVQLADLANPGNKDKIITPGNEKNCINDIASGVPPYLPNN